MVLTKILDKDKKLYYCPNSKIIYYDRVECDCDICQFEDQF